MAEALVDELPLLDDLTRDDVVNVQEYLMISFDEVTGGHRGLSLLGLRSQGTSTPRVKVTGPFNLRVKVTRPFTPRVKVTGPFTPSVKFTGPFTPWIMGTGNFHSLGYGHMGLS